MPHPFHAKSEGRMVYSVPLIIFIDDVSGNISKQWNKHHVIYMSNANMPREMIEKEFSMRTSVMSAAEAGIVAWDCRNNEEVILCPYGLFWGGDNPMHAEECSQAASDEGFQKVFKAGELRMPAETTEQICEQIRQLLLSGGTEKVKNATSATGIRNSTTDSIVSCLLALGKKLQKHGGDEPVLSEDAIHTQLEADLEELLAGETVENSVNPLLGMPGVDIHQDTPTEILHTLLLGVIKYFWGQTVWLLMKSKAMDLFQAQLDSVSTAGLNDPMLGAEYICKYKGGLIGKHFKSLAQVMPYLIYDLIPQTVLDGWTTISTLVILLWHTEIKNTEKYLATLSQVIDDFLNITALCAPSILITVLFSTERYESFNHVFRLASIYNTCNAFTSQDIMKHLATGGFWFDNSQRKWVCAGRQIITYISTHPPQARLLGIKTERPKEPGSQQLSKWRTTHLLNGQKLSPPPFVIIHKANRSTNNTFLILLDTTKRSPSSIVRAIKSAKMSLFFLHAKTATWRADLSLKEILVPVNSNASYKVAAHVALRVPRLKLANKTLVLAPKDVICVVNIQHDCLMSGCKGLTQAPVRQENTETRKTRTVSNHAETASYVLNTYSLHNHQNIASALPDPLKLWTPIVNNVEEVHVNAAKQI
ncbi:hypothetical protein BKA93DRAFT_819596 [Sparassis latifolia]